MSASLTEDIIPYTKTVCKIRGIPCKVSCKDDFTHSPDTKGTSSLLIRFVPKQLLLMASASGQQCPPQTRTARTGENRSSESGEHPDTARSSVRSLPLPERPACHRFEIIGRFFADIRPLTNSVRRSACTAASAATSQLQHEIRPDALPQDHRHDRCDPKQQPYCLPNTIFSSLAAIFAFICSVTVARTS